MTLLNITNSELAEVHARAIELIRGKRGLLMNTGERLRGRVVVQRLLIGDLVDVGLEIGELDGALKRSLRVTGEWLKLWSSRRRSSLRQIGRRSAATRSSSKCGFSHVTTGTLAKNRIVLPSDHLLHLVADTAIGDSIGGSAGKTSHHGAPKVLLLAGLRISPRRKRANTGSRKSNTRTGITVEEAGHLLTDTGLSSCTCNGARHPGVLHHSAALCRTCHRGNVRGLG